jgi:hypothetical protein
MKTFEVQQLIYTKLNPEDSFQKKTDFHIAFSPAGMFSKTELLVFENKIFIPDLPSLKNKQVVFFKTINDKSNLVIINIKTLSQEKDTLGRGGIFIAQFLFFPPEMWTLFPSPAGLFYHTEKILFNSRNELLNSEYISKENGDIKPLLITIDEKEADTFLFPTVENDFEKQLLKFLLDTQFPEKTDKKIILKGDEISCNLLLNKLFCFLPSEKKKMLAWDTSFDGGRMIDNNLPLACYETKPPKGSDYILADISKTRIVPQEQNSKPITQLHSYTKWVYLCNNSINSRTMTDQAFLLSEILETKTLKDCDDILWNINEFCNVNSVLINDIFFAECTKNFTKRFTRKIRKLMLPSDKLLFVLNKISSEKLTEYFTKTITKSGYSPQKTVATIPAEYIAKSKVLSVIGTLSVEKKTRPSNFESLNLEEKLLTAEYFYKSKLYKEKWFLQYITKDSEFLNYFTKSFKKPRKIIKQLIKKLHYKKFDLLKLGFKNDSMKHFLLMKFF